jgi:hypothetical protein
MYVQVYNINAIHALSQEKDMTTHQIQIPEVKVSTQKLMHAKQKKKSSNRVIDQENIFKHLQSAQSS